MPANKPTLSSPTGSEEPTDRPATPWEVYLIISCSHLLASVALPAILASEEARWEPAQGADQMWALGYVAAMLLQYPIAPTLRGLEAVFGWNFAAIFPGYLGYVPVMANSFLCGAILYGLWRLGRWAVLRIAAGSKPKGGSGSGAE
jgi:hypothetical protein